MFESIDFSPGLITYNATNDPDYLKEEDLLQVTYPDDQIVIDLGWYRTRYAIKVVKDMDWENPLTEKACTEIGDVERLLQECADYVRMLIHTGPI